MAHLYRTQNGTLLNPIEAARASVPVYPVLDPRSDEDRRSAAEQQARAEYSDGKLTRAERFALMQLLRRMMSVEEVAVKLSCDPAAVIRLVMGFVDETLAQRVRTALKKDYCQAVMPRKNKIDNDEFRAAPGARELRHLLAETRRYMREEGIVPA